MKRFITQHICILFSITFVQHIHTCKDNPLYNIFYSWKHISVSNFVNNTKITFMAELKNKNEHDLHVEYSCTTKDLITNKTCTLNIAEHTFSYYFNNANPSKEAQDRLYNFKQACMPN